MLQSFVRRFACAAVACTLLAPAQALSAQPKPARSFTLEQVTGYPFPTELTAAATGSRIAWALDERGRRNVYVSEAPEWKARALTRYDKDDGQEITALQLSADGRHVVYVRGGDHGSNFDDSLPVNPAGAAVPLTVQVWSAPFEGGDPKPLGDGDEPAVSPRGDRVAFLKGGQAWAAPIDGSSPAQKLFTARGESGQLQWSPDGARLAFVSRRGDHAFVGVYTDEATPILWLAPSTSRDGSPRWSPDGTRLAFVRRPGSGGAPAPVLEPRHQPWSIWTADARTGAGQRLWQPPTTLRGSIPSTHGETNLHWAASGRIVFLSYEDGWPHLYSIAEKGGDALRLTTGDYMAEYISLSPDRRSLVFAGNTGTTPGDDDRRHVVRVPTDRAATEVLTPGTGLEWTPVVTGDGKWVAYIGATSQRPPLPMVRPAQGG